VTTLPRRPPQPGGGNAPAPVVRAQDADIEILSQVIAEAFCDLPPSRWLIPDRAARREIFPGYFRIYVQNAMAGGTVHTTTDRTAAALWLPVSAAGASPPSGYDDQLAAATGRWIGRFRAFDAVLDRSHPAGTAHHHLAILAVRPDRHGQGTGSRLLRAYHDMLDHDGAPAYLEAATQRTTRLYLRHGYVLQPGAPFCLPDGGPPMWPMWREPHQPAHVPAPRNGG
jgi:GNAT superfamily N-acetyltransferase